MVSSIRFITPQVNVQSVRNLQRELGVSRIVAHLLVLRGYDTPDLARRFLTPDIDRDWHDPRLVPGLVEVAAEVADAIRTGLRIVVFGDFDVDGISATTVMVKGLHELGAREVIPILPRRLEEGYGLTPGAVERVLAENPDFVLTVDNGIAAADEVALFRERGIRVAVTDHHEPGASVPVGIPVADPKLDMACPSRELAGVGVALKLIDILGQEFGKPDLWRDFTDIATLGTVADQMMLADENRALVADGIARMNDNPRPAIAAFLAHNTRDDTLSADGLSYTLLPRMNSAGRMGDATIALDFLLSETLDEAYAHMDELERVNDERREREAACSDSALEQANEQAPGAHVLVLADQTWHDGVKGIVASRIANLFGLPTILLTVDDDGLARGSGRTVGQVNLFEAVASCQDICERFGGHEAAVGITIQADRLDEFRSRLDHYIAGLPPEQLKPAPKADMDVSLDEMTTDLLNELEILAPFGQGNRVPSFVCRGVMMEDRRRMGNPPVHFSCMADDGKDTLRAVYFHPADLDTLMVIDEAVDIMFTAEVNEFRGNRSVQMMVKGIRPAASADKGPDDDLDAFIADLYEHDEDCLDTGDYAGICDADSFHTKAAGVSFEGRQTLLAELETPCDLNLMREPSNEYDSCAVALFVGRSQIGYLNTRLAQRIAPAIDSGTPYGAVLEEVTGGLDGRAYGANILVFKERERRFETERLIRVADTRRRWRGISHESLDDAIRMELIGNAKLHAAQERSLSALAAGNSVLTVMATGRGKSLIFHLHAIRTALREGKASVFVYPLRALVADQAFHLQKTFEAFGLVVRVITGESSEDERNQVFEGLRDGTVDCVLTTPEFLSFHVDRFAETGRVGFVAFDEAHHIGATSGSRSAYSTLQPVLERLGLPTVLAVTATADAECADRICADLHISERVLDETIRENLALVDERGIRDRNTRLAHLVADGGKTIVYVNSREQTIQLARTLRRRLPARARNIAFYNAGVARADRARIEDAFRDGGLDVIVSTSAFGEGVNIPDVRSVVLYHLPFSSVEFNQMAGRCGRDGEKAEVHLLFGKQDARINERILQSAAPTRDEMIVLYRTLRSALEGQGGDGFGTITNATLAEMCSKADARCTLLESGVSSGLSIFRELGLIETRGHGSAREMRISPVQGKVELESSARYLEGIDELSAFVGFRDWVLSASADELLERFNRPILPR